MLMQPADGTSTPLCVLTNSFALSVIFCMGPSPQTACCLLGLANALPAADAVVSGVASRRVYSYGSALAPTTELMLGGTSYSHFTLFSYPTVDPGCMSRETAKAIVDVRKEIRTLFGL
ncbi:MAG: hypothetical protein NTW08_01885 [Gammaproteobacteria bacterium]|nr:hypothetical protein [Gammaproteobacteria bacterium]